MNDFNIQAASMMSGVSVHQIRAWEKRYHALNPRRLGNNFRSYTHENIERLRLLGELTRSGIAISKIAGLETEELKKQSSLLSVQSATKVEVEKTSEIKEKLELLLNFLMAKRFDLVKHEVLKLKTLASVTGVLIPIMKFLMNETSSFSDQESKKMLSVLLEETNRISVNAQGQS